MPGPLFVVVGLIIILGASSLRIHAQPANRAGMTGEQLYQTACAACHGSDGKGQPRSVVGFDQPLPDFTDCAFTTPEADLDWSSVIHEGGRIRSLDRRMPAFGDALSDPEIDSLVDFVRGFCTEQGWPPGDLNFPRAFFTEKAFPENEAVFTAVMARHPAGSVENQFLFEHRIGKRAQYEINVPAGGGGRGGGNAFGDLPAFCRVAATVKPSPESDIKIEVWLPASNWNGKLDAVGNGGWNGNIDNNALAAAMRRGYAAASTDTGHEGGAGVWMQSQQRLIDFGSRAVHETTVKAKTLINAYYGNDAKLSYFTGCSAGGRQALKAAQQYPNDFDGIVGGAPALNTTGRAAFAVWIGQNMHKEEASYIPPTKYGMIHDAVLQACDALDTVKDRVIENPRQCKFDPKVLQCTSGDAATCLTSPQVLSAQTMYKPLMNPATSKKINNGLEYGSEMGWATFGGPQPFGIGTQMYQFMVKKDTSWDYKTMNFDTDIAATDKIENGAINAMDPNMKPFFARGGKLIQYHGWADQQIPPGASVDYYQSVLDTNGGFAKVKDNHRLFMVPGMGHCGGGDGPATFDMLAALEQWVEKGKAPDSIPAAHLANGQPDRTRILCPYPQAASYKGTGDTNDAANFVCK